MKKLGFLVVVTWMVITIVSVNSCTNEKKESKFTEHFPSGIQRTWIGPDYWANRIQDWQINNDRLECLTSQPNRNVNILTRRLTDEPGTFQISVKTGFLTDTLPKNNANWVGLRIGARGQFDDYRDDAIYGKGLIAGITSEGDLFIGDLPVKANGNAKALIPYLKTGLQLNYSLNYSDESYSLQLSAVDPETGNEIAGIVETDVPAQQLHGSLSLVSSFMEMGRNNEIPSCWFDDWKISGTKISHFPERAFGPILFSQYTLSRGTLKLNAQMAPVGNSDGKEVELQVNKNGKWEELTKTHIDPDSRTATFKIENWDDSKDIPYQLVYELSTGKDGLKEYTRTGTIRKNPVDKEELVVAAFTGNNDLGFPNKDVYASIKKIDPDLLFFSGDQIYEGVGGFGVQRAPVEKAILDYLRKWYLYGWEYGDLFRDHPSISIPDDHDAFHGNIWGAGGKATPPGLTGNAAQDAGGYKMPARWVKMMERTQTLNLPDPYDPTPVLQGIGVYYTQLNYGGVSFAIVEDRKFKSAPKPLLPEAKINNGWAQNTSWNAATKADVPGATLLGDRQLDFLEHWVQDWSHHAKIKVVLSQTIFANVATLPKSEHHDAIVPRLRILNKGEYAPDDRPVADMDSDGWPQTGRNKAVEMIRKGFALHIAGDQHLGSLTQYGTKEWRDGSYAFCVPAISNVWPRRWYPEKPGANRKEGEPKYTGDFLDGFGNKVTVYAVSNPVFTGKKPARLYDRATGYGIIKLDKTTRDIEINCWPRFEDPTDPASKEYPGWPVTINQLDNYHPKPYGWLPTIKANTEEPVLKVFNENTGKLVYALRIKGNTFSPPVYSDGSYRVEVSDPDKNEFKNFNNLKPLKTKDSEAIRVELNK